MLRDPFNFLIAEFDACAVTVWQGIGPAGKTLAAARTFHSMLVGDILNICHGNRLVTL